MADRQYSTLSKMGLGVLTFSSALTIYSYWGDAASVALVLLFLCQGRDGDAKIKAAVWALTTPLTATFASGMAPTTIIMPLAVGALVFVCLRDVERVIRAGEGRGGINMQEQHYALAKVGFAALTCHTAVDDYNARRDPGSAAFVLMSYTLLLILTGLFVRGFARAHAADQ